MKESTLTDVLLFAFLAGGFLIFLGSMLKFFNAGDMINGFDENKHDKIKVSKILGCDYLTSGLIVIFLALISLFVDSKLYTLITILQVCVIITGLLLSTFHFYKRCNKNN